MAFRLDQLVLRAGPQFQSVGLVDSILGPGPLIPFSNELPWHWVGYILGFQQIDDSFTGKLHVAPLSTWDRLSQKADIGYILETTGSFVLKL